MSSGLNVKKKGHEDLSLPVFHVQSLSLGELPAGLL